MKKLLIGIIAGLALGSVATWSVLRPREAAAPAKDTAAADKPDVNPLRLAPERRAAAGLVLAKPTAVMLAPEVRAFGRVLDVAPLIALVAELETARAALAASATESARVEKLFAADNNASAQAVETAAAAVSRDRTAVASARARLVAGWGRALADTVELKTVVAELESGGALVRIDVLPGDQPATDLKQAAVGLLSGGELVDVEIMGAAPVADPQFQGTSFLGFAARGALPAGAALRATLAGAGELAKALRVPRRAIVYHEGSAWIYVLGHEDTFERRLVRLGRTTGDEVVVADGVEEEAQVVTTGAQQLLSAELQAGGAKD